MRRSALIPEVLEKSELTTLSQSRIPGNLPRSTTFNVFPKDSRVGNRQTIGKCWPKMAEREEAEDAKLLILLVELTRIELVTS